MKKAKTTAILVLALCLMVWSAKVSKAVPMGTAFTYQGRLMDANGPANGTYDFEFKLYDDPNIIDGNQVGIDVNAPDVDVIDGYFTVVLDFNDVGVFNGDARWLDIGVRPGESTDPNAFVTLSPRTELTPTPYALQTRGIFVDNALNVGIGTTVPGTKLHVKSGGAKAVFGENTASGGIGVQGKASTFSGGGVGVYGQSYSTDGIGVFGIAAMSTGKNYGIYGQSQSPDGWAGYFHGHGHFSGNVGIGQTLDVAGSITANRYYDRNNTDYYMDPANTGISATFAGYIGIGTESPTRDLHIYSNAGPAQVGIVTADASSKAQVIFGDDGGNTWTISSDNTDDNKLHFRSGHASGTRRVTFQQNGNVGIGTTAPVDKLHVKSRIRIEGSGTSFPFLDLVNSAGTGRWTLYGNNDDDFRIAEYVGSLRGDRIVIQEGGNVGIGKTNPAEKLDVAGTVQCQVLKITGGSDIAEPFDVKGTDMIKAGMVLSIDSENPGKLKISERPYDRCVAGIISGAGGVKSGMLMSQLDSVADGEYPVALTGRVYCWVDASKDAIEPGDMLTTSSVPGHAMKATDRERSYGAVIGKAMSSLEEGKGLVLVLVTLQ